MITDKELILTNAEVKVLFSILDFVIDDVPDFLDKDALDSLYGKVITL